MSFLKEVQAVHETGYFSQEDNLEERWTQNYIQMGKYLQREPAQLTSFKKIDNDVIWNQVIASRGESIKERTNIDLSSMNSSIINFYNNFEMNNSKFNEEFFQKTSTVSESEKTKTSFNKNFSNSIENIDKSYYSPPSLNIVPSSHSELPEPSPSAAMSRLNLTDTLHSSGSSSSGYSSASFQSGEFFPHLFPNHINQIPFLLKESPSSIENKCLNQEASSKFSGFTSRPATRFNNNFLNATNVTSSPIPQNNFKQGITNFFKKFKPSESSGNYAINRSSSFSSQCNGVLPHLKEETKTSKTKNHSYEEEKKRIYKCFFEGCTKSYTKNSHLKTHMRTHTGERPFQCTWEGCNWKFSRSDELRRHQRKHTGIKPFECLTCGKSFSRSDHLKSHSRKHQK